jgi:hypothetical protein
LSAETFAFTINVMEDGLIHEFCREDGRERLCQNTRYELTEDRVELLADCTTTLQFVVDGDQLRFDHLGVECDGAGELPPEIRWRETVLYTTLPFTHVD